MDKMKFPGEQGSSPAPRESINKMLADFVSYCNSADFEDGPWIENQKQLVDKDIFFDANHFIKKLARKLEIKLSTKKYAKAPTKKKG